MSFKEVENTIELVWDVQETKDYLKNIDKKPFPKVMPYSMKILVDHFKKDGWNIDMNYAVQEIANELLGFSVLEYCLHTLAKKGLPIGLVSDKYNMFFYMDKDEATPPKKRSSRKRKK